MAVRRPIVYDAGPANTSGTFRELTDAELLEEGSQYTLTHKKTGKKIGDNQTLQQCKVEEDDFVVIEPA